MGRFGEEELDLKSQLVTQICSIASHSITSSCSCRTHRSIKSHFIDWYLLLQVEEDAHIDIIRKQYRKLVLQLHPDKNKHPKAEVAFKLVSEAYSCLSDKAKRKTFDYERCNSFCKECHKTSLKTCNFPPETVRPDVIAQRLREVRDRFREEVRVIENCLKVNKASRKESPLFDPSNNTFKDYPHYRKICKTPEDFWYLQAGNSRNYDQRKGACESPIFEIRSERRPLHRQSAFLRVLQNNVDISKLSLCT